MPQSPRAALCPVAIEEPSPAPYPHSPPYPKRRSERGLALSLTLPGDPRSAAIGRNAVTASLRAYGLTAYIWPAALVLGELVGVTSAMTPGRELYVSVRHRDNALRVVVWDQHPHHSDPGAFMLCEAQRRRALWLLAAAVDDWGGEWDVSDALSPHAGIKSWVVLPR
ncbi:ATP-binding protein [Streptomyces sp. NPDC051020]|uniref:ATP-binding protein n=1 Tax=Streptomyces sp. NPDC051020 TaxID=3155409 RepID=UPI0034445E8A